MCFSLQRRAIFPHRNFKKWSETVSFLTFWLGNVLLATQRRAIFRHLNVKKCSETVSFLTFWLENVLLATAACNFFTSELQKAVRPWGVLHILTWKCASCYSGVQFVHIWTSKSGPPMRCFVHFDLKMCFSLQRRANFSTSQLQKVVRDRQFFTILTWKCASRYSGVQFFMFSLNSYLRTRRFTEVTFRPSPPTNHWKTQHFATSLTFRACGSSFYWLSRNCIFFLLTLLLFSALSSSDSAALLCFFNCPYCRKLDF